jgi:hypothetical protein
MRYYTFVDTEGDFIRLAGEYMICKVQRQKEAERSLFSKGILFGRLQYKLQARMKSTKLHNIDEKVFGLFNNRLYTPRLEHNDAVSPDLIELAKLPTSDEGSEAGQLESTFRRSEVNSS